MKISDNQHLCYSLNVYPGTGLDRKLDTLRNAVPKIRKNIRHRKFATEPFAAGLWLDIQTVNELQDKARLEELKRVLDESGLYVFTVNAFPYGEFHGRIIKKKVYEPDWATDERLKYTCMVADILSELLPEGVSGSISTLPGTYGKVSADKSRLIADNLLRCTDYLKELEERKGKRIVLAVEMEPDCLWDSPEGFAEFYSRNISGSESAEYLGVCYDTCHQELLKNKPGEGLDILCEARVPIAKIQLSSAIRALSADSKQALEHYFNDDVYLHQTCAGEQRFPDLPEALASAGRNSDWKIHYHVPVYGEHLNDGLRTASEELEAVLKKIKQGDISCSHLEIETYTYSVLPDELRKLSLEESIAAEYDWVLDKLGVVS
jgi:hypothetical protein